MIKSAQEVLGFSQEPFDCVLAKLRGWSSIAGDCSTHASTTGSGQLLLENTASPALSLMAPSAAPIVQPVVAASPALSLTAPSAAPVLQPVVIPNPQPIGTPSSAIASTAPTAIPITVVPVLLPPQAVDKTVATSSVPLPLQAAGDGDAVGVAQGPSSETDVRVEVLELSLDRVAGMLKDYNNARDACRLAAEMRAGPKAAADDASEADAYGAGGTPTTVAPSPGAPSVIERATELERLARTERVERGLWLQELASGVRGALREVSQRLEEESPDPNDPDGGQALAALQRLEAANASTFQLAEVAARRAAEEEEGTDSSVAELSEDPGRNLPDELSRSDGGQERQEDWPDSLPLDTSFVADVSDFHPRVLTRVDEDAPDFGETAADMAQEACPAEARMSLVNGWRDAAEKLRQERRAAAGSVDDGGAELWRGELDRIRAMEDPAEEQEAALRWLDAASDTASELATSLRALQKAPGRPE